MMERVGRHLQVQAIALTDNEERDVFGRSAYNRYYYAAFLRARKMVDTLDSDWARLPHKDYPELLKGKVRKALLKGKLQATKIGDVETINVFSRAMAAAVEIASLMENAARVRVTADYNPHIPIEFLPGGRFSLNNVDITVAHQWIVKTEAWAEAIERAWSQLDV